MLCSCTIIIGILPIFIMARTLHLLLESMHIQLSCHLFTESLVLLQALYTSQFLRCTGHSSSMGPADFASTLGMSGAAASLASPTGL